VRAILPVCPACHTPRGKTPTVSSRRDPDDVEEGIQTHLAAGQGPIVEQVQERVKQPGNVMPSASLLPAAAESETDIELPPLATMAGDAMARRAFYGALFGPASAGLLTLYSLWLLMKLGFYRGELSAQGMRHLYLAVFILGAYALLIFLLCAG
jgi:hypothetical protein